jgi:hypothetical protein
MALEFIRLRCIAVRREDTVLKTVLIIAGLLLLSACAYHTSAIMPAPTSTTELIRNITVAVENSLFESPDFYERENLSKVFGATAVTIQTGPRLVGDIMRWFDTNYYVLDGFSTDFGIEGLHGSGPPAIALTRKMERDRFLAVDGILYFGSPPGSGSGDIIPTFDELMATLGHGWKEDVEGEVEAWKTALQVNQRYGTDRPIPRYLFMAYAFRNAPWHVKSIILRFHEFDRKLYMIQFEDSVVQ